ncbi:unknown [Prevotella sp. CAG:487]|nr:unknown [Prevotella sp. CAG:487]
MRIKYLHMVIVRFISFLLICNINTYIIMCDEKF